MGCGRWQCSFSPRPDKNEIIVTENTFEVAIDKLVSGGDGFARLPSGKAVFISGAYPHETVRAKIIQEKKDFVRAHVTQIICPSQHRTTSFCPHFGICGGCQWQDLSYQEQCHQKQLLFQEICRRAKIHFNNEPIFFPSPQTTEIRHRFHFHTQNGKIGFLGRKSHQFIAIQDCPIAAKPIRYFISSYQHIHSSDSFHVFANAQNQCFIENQDAQCNVTILGKRFIFSPDLFFQNHLSLLEKLIPLVINEEKGKVAVDLYAGVGLFSAFLENNFPQVFACEANQSVVPFFAINASKTKNFPLSVDSFIKQHIPPIDFAIVDPPRQGLSPQLINYFLKKLPKKIAYISCDPVTQMRDLQRLCEKYTIESAYIFDFYPHTAHMETLIHLQLK